MPVDPSDLITLKDAMTRWGHAYAWWREQITAGKIMAYQIEGDRNTYLSRSALEAFFEPKPYMPGKADEGSA